MPDPMCSTCPAWREHDDIEFATCALVHTPEASLGICHNANTVHNVTEANCWCTEHPDSALRNVKVSRVLTWHAGSAETWEEHHELRVL